MPPTLYGRAVESAALSAAFNRVRENEQTVTVLISGPSGVGKSSLVTEFQSGLTLNEALATVGKFDVQTQGVPYAALTQAFGSLFRQILTYDGEEVPAWRRTLTEAVGPNGHLMTDLISRVGAIIGPQSPVADLTPQDRSNRFASPSAPRRNVCSPRPASRPLR